MKKRPQEHTSKTEIETSVVKGKIFGYDPWIILTAVFVFSRIVYLVLGVRFDDEPLGSFWQFIDPTLMKTDLLRSLYYLHSQPPLFNLFLGIVVKLFPGYEAAVFQAVFVALGLALNLSLFALLVRFRAGHRLAMILVVVFMVSPASILYESFLFYTYPVAAILCFSALFLHRYLHSHGITDLILFFAMLLFLTLTRSFFHILWMAVIWGVLVYFRRPDCKRLFIVGGIFLVLCLSVYTKNAYLFGSFSTSSWFGMNITRMTTWRLDLEERNAQMHQRNLSPLASIKTFRKLEVYERLAGLSLAPPTGIPVLDQPMKSTGAPNLNNFNYIPLSKQYSRDAWYVFKNYPGLYFKSLAESLHIYCLPSSSYSFLAENRSRLTPLDRAYNLILFGQFDYEETITDRRPFFSTGLSVMLGYLLAIIYGFLLIRKSFPAREVNYTELLTLMFLWFNLVYITVFSNAFELGENNRFRFITEPVFLVLLGVAIKNKFRLVEADQS